MQFIEIEKKEDMGITSMLLKMDASPSVALEVAEKDVTSARSIITRLHNTTDLRFTTQKTETGILVWRTA